MIRGYTLNHVQSRQIRLNMVDFQLKINRVFFIYYRIFTFSIVLLLIGYLVFFQSRGFALTLIILLIAINIFVLQSVQWKLSVASKAIEKKYKRLGIERVNVFVEYKETGYTSITEIGKKTYRTDLTYQEIYHCQYNQAIDGLVFSTRRFVYNFSKKRARCLYLGDLESQDKQHVLQLFKQHAKHFCMVEGVKV